MRNSIAAVLFLLLGSFPASAKSVVFWQSGFPTIDSRPVAREVLAKALGEGETVFAGIDALKNSATLKGADLMVLPYGSALPADAWSEIQGHLRAGGSLLILGGRPFRVPVRAAAGSYIQERPQDTYAREINIRHTYEAPRTGDAKFAWKSGYSFLRSPAIRARRFFALEGRLNGLGYMVNSEGLEVAAPVVVADHAGAGSRSNSMAGSRIVMLDFDPEEGFWESDDGVLLLGEAAEYARQGAVSFWTEVLFSTLKPGEMPQAAVHLRDARRERTGARVNGEAKLQILSDGKVLDDTQISCSGAKVDADVFFHKAFPPGFYVLRGEYSNAGRVREAYQNGFWVEDEQMLATGPKLGVMGDFLTRDGKVFFPVGTNHFTTEANGWDFSGPRNAWVWERDFADMARYGVTFVRTGVWMGNSRFVEPSSGAVNERFIRNLEAYFLCARRHGIIVNFTFFSFSPHSGGDQPGTQPPNPYIDPGAVRAQQDYIVSIVNRFRAVPWLCWDLINEPSFSNPNRLWKGNTPNGDPAEAAAWRKWLRGKYAGLRELGAAWSVPEEQLGSFDSIPLPSEQDLAFARYRNLRAVRALDYNLFAQDMFSQWVRSMITAIRSAGSDQLVNVGQDEGGVADRVLNQFYASAGVAFTTNHSYWRDDALLWDSVAAKRPGVPNIVGETGYQPVWAPDGTWRYDEVKGYALQEKKWVLGFAAANSGVLHWDWDREVDFGIKRSDGSAKTWQPMMREMARFAEAAASRATRLIEPQTAVVLPQSLQLSVLNGTALEAQQKAVRALFYHARAQAYAVGEYQIGHLGNPKLIILPAPVGLSAKAWEVIRGKVEAGATLLVSGRFDGDAHFHPTGRQKEAGLPYEPGALTIRENLMRWPGGEARLIFGGDKTTYLDRAFLPDGSAWAERALGKGKILFAPLPMELNENLQAVGAVYRYAAKSAGVDPVYSTELDDPGILICPTRFPGATLYVLVSESSGRDVSFRDLTSGKQFSSTLDPGRSAMLLVADDGALLASYNWSVR